MGDTSKAVGFFSDRTASRDDALPVFQDDAGPGGRADRARLPKVAQRGGSRRVQQPSPAPPPPAPRPAGAAAKTIEFRSGGSASLVVSGDVFGLSAADRTALFSWIDAMTKYEDEAAADPSASD